MKTINYAQRLRKARLFLNITQRELSIRLGVSASSISRYETERTPVSLRVRKWVKRMYRKHNLAKRVIKSAKDNSVCAFMPQRCYSIADDDKILSSSFVSLQLRLPVRRHTRHSSLLQRDTWRLEQDIHQQPAHR